MLIKLSLVSGVYTMLQSLLLTIDGQVHMRYGGGLDLEVHPAFVQPSVKGFRVVQHEKTWRHIRTEESSALEHLVIRPVAGVLKTVV